MLAHDRVDREVGLIAVEDVVADLARDLQAVPVVGPFGERVLAVTAIELERVIDRRGERVAVRLLMPAAFGDVWSDPTEIRPHPGWERDGESIGRFDREPDMHRILCALEQHLVDVQNLRRESLLPDANGFRGKPGGRADLGFPGRCRTRAGTLPGRTPARHRAAPRRPDGARRRARWHCPFFVPIAGIFYVWDVSDVR